MGRKLIELPNPYLIRKLKNEVLEMKPLLIKLSFLTTNSIISRIVITCCHVTIVNITDFVSEELLSKNTKASFSQTYFE